MGMLAGKTAVITGGTRGLGLAIAQVFAQEGAAVMVASRSASAVEAAVAQIRAEGGRADGMALDIANLSQVEALADRAIEVFGRLDIWINNAGVAGPYGPTLALAPDAFDQVIDTNIRGMYYGSRTALEHFTAQRSGKLINMLGAGADGPVAWQNAYASSKTWVRSFTKALAEENKDSGVGIFAFNPGMVLTDLLTDLRVIEGSEQRLKVFPTVVRILARPPEMPARRALWIASAATDGKTGLEVKMVYTWGTVQNAWKELVRALRRQPAPQGEIKITPVAPYRRSAGG